jgi:hypothetical protein
MLKHNPQTTLHRVLRIKGLLAIFPTFRDNSLSFLANDVNSKQVLKLTNMINCKAPDLKSVFGRSLAACCVQKLHSEKHALTAKARMLIILLTYVDGVCY